MKKILIPLIIAFVTLVIIMILKSFPDVVSSKDLSNAFVVISSILY